MSEFDPDSFIGLMSWVDQFDQTVMFHTNTNDRLVDLAMNVDADTALRDRLQPIVLEDSCCRIIQGRCPYEVSVGHLLVLSMLSEGIPGRCVMLAHAYAVARHRAKKDLLYNQESPFYKLFIPEPVYDSVWEQQKCYGSERTTNWLDCPETWKRFGDQS